MIVDRSIEQEGGIELDEEVRKNFPVIDNLNELFGEEDEDDEEFAQVQYEPGQEKTCLQGFSTRFDINWAIRP